MQVRESRIDAEAARRFASSLDGWVIRPGDEAYEQARRVFNAMIDRHPELIVRVAGSDDVRRSIAFARERDLPISIRGGGHNVAGNAIADGGLVIDFSERRSVRVDPETGTARAEAGATWYDFDQATQGFGLATTGGLISSTGVAGFTLGGGIGWLVRKHGLACDNLVRAELVTAEGRTVTAGPDDDAELLWGIRGGGGNFGVATSLTYGVHPLGTTFGGAVFHPRDAAPELFRRWRDLIADAPEALTTVAALVTSPEGHPVCAVAACYAGDPAEGERLLQPLRDVGAPVQDLFGPMPYTVVQTMLDPSAPPGMRHYWKADFLGQMTDEAIDLFVEAANAAASPVSQIHLHQLGGAMSRPPEGGSAFAHRDAPFVFNVLATWPDPTDDEVNMTWAREWFERLGPARAGSAYVNFLGDDGAERVRAAYAHHHDRLVELKRRTDPDNVFRLNQNIAP